MVLTERFGVSERRTCAVAGQHRSTQRRPSARCEAHDERVRARLREIAHKHPRWGWKTAHQILRRDGKLINRKRTRRLWREEGHLRRPTARKRKRRRGPTGELFRAQRPNHVWALDFQVDETADQFARAGPSNVARKPSPVQFTARPLDRSISRRTSASYSSSSQFQLLVAHLGRALGRADDVGEKNRGEDPILDSRRSARVIRTEGAASLGRHSRRRDRQPLEAERTSRKRSSPASSGATARRLSPVPWSEIVCSTKRSSAGDGRPQG